MKIIKHGDTSPLYVPPVLIGVCPKCGCEFEIENTSDTYTKYVDEYRGGGDVIFCNCPECGHKKIEPLYKK